MSAPDTPPTDRRPSSPPDSPIEAPENLPPVEPPSAGFIIQLFIVPALIVGAVIGVWLLFGSLATTDTNWERQVHELRADSAQRRGRAAYTLSQMLQADLKAGDKGNNLRSNKELAAQLADILNDHLAKASPSKAEEEFRAFLIKTLGWLDVDEVTLPVLIKAFKTPSQENLLQINSLTAIIYIASRDFENGQSLDNEQATATIFAASRHESSRVRQLAAYALGFIDADGVDQRLKVLLEDSDRYVRANAAIALTRKKSTEGLGVLKSILRQAGEEESPLETVDPSDREAVKEANAREIETIVMTKNALKAVEELIPQLSNSEKERITPLIKTLANDFREPRIKLAAEKLLQSLQQN